MFRFFSIFEGSRELSKATGISPRSFNIFEGSRRIALLAGLLATGLTLYCLITNNARPELNYSVARPGAPFVREFSPCPKNAARKGFSTDTRSGNRVYVNLYLHKMPFGDKQKMLVPYKIDENGRIWGAEEYSKELREYEDELERSFVFSQAESDLADEACSREYWKELWSGIAYLLLGLAIYWAILSTIGWIVRGFLGIPRGMDRQPGTNQ